ncbi:unnamed protein product, partial [Protopolystoma xenopodis]
MSVALMIKKKLLPRARRYTLTDSRPTDYATTLGMTILAVGLPHHACGFGVGPQPGLPFDPTN